MAILRHAQVVSDTGSLLAAATVDSNTITFTKGDGSSFPITIDTGSSGTAAANSVTYWASATIITGSTKFNWDNNGGGNYYGLGIGTSSVGGQGTRLKLASTFAEDSNADLEIETPFNQRIIFTNSTSSRKWYISSDAQPTGPNARDGLYIGTTQNPASGLLYLNRSGSLSVSASLQVTGSASITSILTLRNLTTLPAGTVGSLGVSGSVLYFHNGTSWTAIT